MSSIGLVTHEIGSLAKTPWRLKALSGAVLNASDLKAAVEWGRCLHIANVERLHALLAKRQGFTLDERAEILRFSSLFATKLLEQAGLDLVWDGEQQRVEMYEYAARRMTGFTFGGHIRSFDNKYYCKGSCVHRPGFERPFHVQEYRQIVEFATKPIKIPLTGAYTMMDWTYDENYSAAVVPGKVDVREQQRKARREFLEDITQRVIYPNIKALYEQGVRYIQLDEPAATTKRDEVHEFIQATKKSIGDMAGKAFFSVHICFSDYRHLFPQLKELQGILDEVHFEYANRDTKELGITPTQRVGYEILHQFKNTSFKVGIGVLDVHTDFIESPELVRDRILYVHKIINDPTRLYISPDCGLRTRTWEVSFQKLKNMVEGRNLAAKALGLL